MGPIWEVQSLGVFWIDNVLALFVGVAPELAMRVGYVTSPLMGERKQECRLRVNCCGIAAAKRCMAWDGIGFLPTLHFDFLN